MMKKVSIITVNLNNKEGLERTMQSVFDQTYKEYDYLIVDGGSTDGSKELIQAASGKITYWISEKDTGIYNAMNKGIQRAAGDYILFLNSGDYFIDASILKELDLASFDEDIIYGNLLIREEKRDWVKRYPSQLTFDYFTRDTLPHSGGCFVKKNLFDKVGLYDENYKILADWEFFVKAIFKDNCRTLYLDKTISAFGFDGLSAKQESKEIIKSELEHMMTTQFKTLFELNAKYQEINRKYKLLMNSRGVKAFLNIKKLVKRNDQIRH